MEVTIKLHSSERMSREFKGEGVELWEVYQGGVLVGVYRSRSDALKYKYILEKKLSQERGA
ncbi:hypothetical protein IPC1599_24160 [Pseudomonas aeruginosa]|nr:hypothetical protein U769_24692 [Pseudomonas aeruginosa MTB-1]PNU09684.1 hypothetical protein C2M06_22970 [Pseudomonas aeruginosa]TEB79915.1 hypothetical protein IPC1604_07635 [Pseudomonas aeruginosa]TEC19848.1 hypothetical protein IPC1599_24160 [Pseudomonas aeruginosa]